MSHFAGLTFYFFLLVVLVGFPPGSRAADQKIINVARKEGTMTWYTTMPLPQSKKMVDRFEKKYPFIKVKLLRTGAAPLQNRILTEALGGKHLWDVVSITGIYFPYLADKGLVVPYRSPERKMYEEDLKDKKGYWTSPYVNPNVLGYNTQLVKKEEVPQTYEDLLLAKWKGDKILLDTTAFPLLQGLSMAWGREKAISYFERLAGQDPVLMRGNTARMQLVAAGEFPLVFAYAWIIEGAKRKGAPIDWVTLEPTVVQLSVTMLGAKASNPGSGKLFIDFILSKEGQEMVKGFRRIPTRTDVDPDPPRLFKGYRRIVDHPDRYKDLNKIISLYQKIFKLR